MSLKVPKLKGAVFSSAVIERYRRREESVGEALIDMYLAGVSTRQVDDVSQLLWGDRMPSQTLSVYLVKSVFRVGGGDVLLDFVVCMVVGQCTGWFQATSPSWMRLSMMLMPYSVLMRLSRYQTMYSSSIAVNSSIVTPRKLLLWKNSCLRRPKNPSAAALSGEQPFALIDRVSPCSVQMRIHSGHR